MTSQEAFVVMQIGDKGTAERKRADDIYKYVVTPVLKDVGIRAYRADLDPTPGKITPQMLRKLLEARFVVADLTGRNPNVFYELGVAHSFARPVIAIAESARSLPFDTFDERVIELGEYREVLAVAQAEEAKVNLRRAVDVILDPSYSPDSPLAEAAANRSLDELAPENPMAAELGAIRVILEEVRTNVRPRSVPPPNQPETAEALTAAATHLLHGGMPPDEVERLLVPIVGSEKARHYLFSAEVDAAVRRGSR